MAKRFTPIIGLAVVVALAFAAVFGAMSLTNPAFAAVGEPADAELTERGFSPQQAMTSVAIGEALTYDITSLITGGGANFAGADVTCVPVCDDSGTDNPINAANPTVGPDFGAINLMVLGTNVDNVGRVRMTIDVDLIAGANQEIVVDITVTPVVNEAPTVKEAILDQKVVIRTVVGIVSPATVAPASDSVSTKIDLADYFNNGRGSGVIATYSAVAAPSGGVLFTADTLTQPTGGSELEMFLGDGGTEQLVAVTVTATDTANPTPNTPSITFFVNVVAPGSDIGPSAPGGKPSFSYLSADPGKNTRYELRFPAPKNMNTLTDEIVIELEDFTVPSSIDEDSIAVTVTDGCVKMAGGNKDCTTTPQDIAVSGEKIFITVGDLDKASDDTANDFSITEGEVIAVVIRQSAGISNPTEAGKYGPVAEVLFGNNQKSKVADFDGVDELTIPVPRILSLDEEDGGLGTEVNATGKGFKNGTSLTVFVDKLSAVMWNPRGGSDNMVPLPANMVEEYDALVVGDDTDRGNVAAGTIPTNDDGDALYDDDGDALAPNRKLDLGEDTLCEVSKIGGDDVGICEFTVTHPTFSGGINYINAVDGRNGYISDGEGLGEFELTASISASPAGGSPGEIILLQMVDFPVGPVVKVELSRTEVCGPSNTTPTCNGSVDLTGSGNFKIIIPNWAKSGNQELRVTGQNDAADDPVRGAKNVVISGPQIQVTPGSVVANQRISLVGVGFSSGAHITRVAPGIPQVSKMSVGGKEISWARINGGQPVEVDSGGNWSAAVDLPLHEATTAEGDRTIRITDSGGRTGSVTVVIAAREVTITPAIGRVGTLATVRGMNFPSKNDDGSSFNVALVYDAGNDKQTTVSAVPDASGRFEVQLRIPTTASIPSTNTVKVQFDDDDDVTVVTTVTHEVPEGAINLSQTSGSPGSTVSISGVGFKSFVPVKSVMVGALEVTPSPRPSTDSQGMMTFQVLIPGLDVGIQTIEVQVGGTTASVGFTVTTSGVAAGNITESSLAVMNLGDNFVRSFNFNNDTKTWTFYSPEAPDDSTQTSFITGESYWILIGESQEVILNGRTRNLTCSAAGNCWNLIVW